MNVQTFYAFLPISMWHSSPTSLTSPRPSLPLPQGIVKAPTLELARVTACIVSDHAFPVFL